MSIISLAWSRNFDFSAEGVERDHQLMIIQELSCQYRQGFLFSEPMDQGEIDTRVRSKKFNNIPSS